MQTLCSTKKKLRCTREGKKNPNKDKRQTKNLLKVGHLFKVAELHILGPKNVCEKCSEIIRPQYSFWVWKTFWDSVAWSMEAGWQESDRELRLCPCFGGSKGVTELTRWEVWSAKGDVGHFMLQRNSKVLHVTMGSVEVEWKIAGAQVGRDPWGGHATRWSPWVSMSPSKLAAQDGEQNGEPEDCASSHDPLYRNGNPASMHHSFKS